MLYNIIGDIYMNKINILQEIINKSNNIVVFSGAGVSTESGLKDFRSVDGLYNMNYKYNPEEILSHHFFINNTKDFYDFYKDKLNIKGIKPNDFHYFLVKLEKIKKLKAVITQNIDNLHTLAGSKVVLELHGNVTRNYCTKCHKFYNGDYVFNSQNIPLCDCGSIIKPDVVLYEEELNYDLLDEAIKYISNADTLIVAGTSLTVYPAAGLIRYFKGKNLVIINKDTTTYDSIANLVINDSLKNVVSNLKI